MQDTIKKEIGSALDELRAKTPLVHHITNYVTVNDCANVTLAIGASPIMADAIEEAGAIASIASSLVINIGTLNSRTVDSMLAAGKSANAANVPVILDPVGAGASTLRNETSEKLLSEIKLSVLRGNLSEIRFLAGLAGATKGVDAGDVDTDSEENIQMAKQLAASLKTVVAITGATDVVTDGSRTLLLKNGHPMLSKVTGTGCMTSSLVGSFLGADTDAFYAAAGGILSMAIAGEQSFHSNGQTGTGSFRTGIIDALSRLTGESLAREAILNEI